MFIVAAVAVVAVVVVVVAAVVVVVVVVVVEGCCIFIYIIVDVPHPYRVPQVLRFPRFFDRFFLCFPRLNGEVYQNRSLLQKFIWRYYSNAFGAF